MRRRNLFGYSSTQARGRKYRAPGLVQSKGQKRVRKMIRKARLYRPGALKGGVPSFGNAHRRRNLSAETVIRVRQQYVSGAGKRFLMDHFRITAQQLDDILSGKYGQGKYNPRHRLTVPEKHQLKIARDTLKMSDAMVSVMGGMSKGEARQVIYRLTGKLSKNVSRYSGVHGPALQKHLPKCETCRKAWKYSDLCPEGKGICEAEAIKKSNPTLGAFMRAFPPSRYRIVRNPTLSDAEAKVLLHKHATGDFGKHTWSTIKALMNKGYLAEEGKNLVVTAKGKQWADENHMRYSF